MRHLVSRAAVLAAVIWMAWGCTPTTPPPAVSPTPPVVETSAPHLSIPTGETWDVILMQGSPLGYMHTVTREVQQDGQTLLEVSATQRMTVQRFGDQAAPGASFRTLESRDGRMQAFESQQQIGPTAQTARGTVQNGQLVIETSTTGKTETTRIPWKDDYRGLFALEHAMLRQPLKAGEQRTVQALAPIFNQLATYEFTAREEEETLLLDGTSRLMHIDVVTRFANGNTVRSIVWANATGEILKTRTDAFSWETFRTTKERAQGGLPTRAADLGLSTVVRLAQPLARAHQTRRVRYEVTVRGEPGGGADDSAKAFSTGNHQQVKPLGENKIEILVTAPRPSTGPQPTAEPMPQEADLKPNNLIQSDHPLVVQMAREAAGGETNPAQRAAALERYVKTNVRNKNFTQALATAADVAQTREGDCTEHAVLLAALARANGIPARVAIGLVYVEGLQGFGYHMWNELYVDGSWMPFDATLGQGGIGAAHLKLATSSLAGGDALAAFLPVAQVLGRLQIKVLEAE